MTTTVHRMLHARGYSQDAEGAKKFQKAAGLVADGIVGPKTRAALTKFPKKGMLSTAKIISIYGQPGDTKNFTIIPLPYPQRVAWDLKTSITKMQVHKKVADRLKAIYSELLHVYGLPAIQQLGIDLYGGCYNFRKMRGGTSWSRHSWAIAVDHDPARNQLHETAATARFARPEYAAMIWIFLKHKFVNQGVEKGWDFMHFETYL